MTIRSTASSLKRSLIAHRTSTTLAAALAAFERVVVTGPAAYDAYEALSRLEQVFSEDLEDLQAFEEDEPKSPCRDIEAKRAAKGAADERVGHSRSRVFLQRESQLCRMPCWGVNFTDEKYHNLGVGMDAAEPDLGGALTSPVTKRTKGPLRLPHYAISLKLDLTCTTAASTARYVKWSIGTLKGDIPIQH